MAHTKGPWKLQNQWVTDDTGLVTIATLPVYDGTAPKEIPIGSYQNEFNANLIAAAPDLLAVCKRMTNLFDELPANYLRTASDNERQTTACLLQVNEAMKAALLKAEKGE